MFCRNCGQKVEDNAEFCPNCGTKINDDSQNKVVNTVQSNQRYTNQYTNMDQRPYKKSGSKLPLIISIIVIAIVAVIGISIFAPSQNKYVKFVKSGHPDNYPNITYGEAFDDFFGLPRWEYFKGKDGEDVVEFTGDCRFHDQTVKAKMQFLLNVKNGTFEAGYFSMNEVPQVKLMTAVLINKVFSEYGKKKAGKGEITNSQSKPQVPNESRQTDTAQTTTQPRGITSEEAKSCVAEYIGALNGRQFREAYNKLSKEWQSEFEYETWVHGYDNTVSQRISSAGIANANSECVTINFVLRSKDRNGSGGTINRTFQGTWDVIRENGKLVLDNPNVKVIN